MVQVQLDLPTEIHLLLTIQAKKRKISLQKICIESLSKVAVKSQGHGGAFPEESKPNSSPPPRQMTKFEGE